MKNDCIAIVQYRPLEALPPVMTLLNVLKRIGENVVFIGIEGPTGAAFFESAGVPYRFLIPTHKSRLARGATFYPRRWQLLSILKELRREYGKVTIWFQECHSAALAGNAMYAFGRPIVTFFEYECNLGERWFGFDLERLYHTAVVVECERTRAEMTQKNHGLSETPLVIANKPEIDASQIPDLVPALAVCASFADGVTRITNAERLRIKESDRLISTAALINSLGGEAKELPDGLVIRGSRTLIGGTVKGFNDHRIVMSAAICAAGTDALSVNKSYPGFFDDYNSVGGKSEII